MSTLVDSHLLEKGEITQAITTTALQYFLKGPYIVTKEIITYFIVILQAEWLREKFFGRLNGLFKADGCWKRQCMTMLSISTCEKRY